MKLYGYWRSTSSYRVRIALNLKGLSYEQAPVHLVRDGGEHNAPAFKAINPAGRVPALVLDEGTTLTQSLAIADYLDSLQPEPRLAPADPVLGARTRAFALHIACDMQPLHNKAVMDRLTGPMGHSTDDFKAWVAHWSAGVFGALEAQCASPYAMGEAVTLADVCLVPALYAARRFGVPLEAYPRLVAADLAARALGPVAAAAPERQPDAPADARAV